MKINDEDVAQLKEIALFPIQCKEKARELAMIKLKEVLGELVKKIK